MESYHGGNLYFRKSNGMSRTLLQMKMYNGGNTNLGYSPDGGEEPDRDYGSSVGGAPIESQDAPVRSGDDSGRGSREGVVYLQDDNSTVESSIQQADEEVAVSGKGESLCDESVDHFRIGAYSSDDSLDESSTNSDDRPMTPKQEDTLESRSAEWNVFAISSHLAGDESRELCFAVARKIFKVMTYIIMLPCVLGLIIMSKGSLLIAVSNMRPYPVHNDNNTITDTTENTYDLRCRNFTDKREITEKDGNETVLSIETFSFTKCVAIPQGYNTSDVEALDNRSCMKPGNDTGNLTVIASYSINECYVVRNYWAWSILMMICAPYVFVFLRCFWRILFKKKKSPTASAMLATLVVETLHTIGICMLFFIVLPSLDNAILALMFLLGVAMIPGILKIFVRPENEKMQVFHIILDCLAALAQVSVLVCWPLLVAFENNDYSYDSKLTWSIPASLFLVSIRWWENFVDRNSRFGRLREHLNILSGEMRRSRTKIQLLASVWKIGVSILAMMFCMATQVDYMNPLYSLQPFDSKLLAIFDFSLSRCQWDDENDTVNTIDEREISEMQLDWVWMWLVNCTTSLVCYFFARSAAKMRIQQVCYSLPLAISTPFIFGLMIGGCELWNNDPCTFTTSEISGYLFYKCYRRGDIDNAWFQQMWFLLPVWWLSQFWITWHVWFPKSPRLATADMLFVLPLYDGVLMEQSLFLNRERNDEPRTRARVIAASGTRADNQVELARMERIEDVNVEDFLQKTIRKRDEVPLIYICATMWHENETEMIKMLTSILRLDMDQVSRRNAQKYFNIVDPDYYEFEGHIFFDNAFDNHDNGQKENYRTNDYVRLLVSVVDQAATSVHGINLSIPSPVIHPTPYGGRLVWTLPGGNKLITHLKDSAKIRHKKRWSQVMYMYYFLGYNLWMDKTLPMNRKQRRAENIFLLALDGDVDFEPLALILLIDLMKRNSNLGAACGRIHPNGTGPMVWYQLFEYALGHWMQKATEHVIGCVLCSPGCFSLFRGMAMMEDNVMAKYTTKPTEPAHHIQYDQGEDRWLCTLILQQGYRVEYCAASDSVTFAPEGFNEFFNQRRRWMPSTMANVFDLLSSWHHTTTVNDNLSLLYITYQAFLLGASIVGPGTIFMMMIGAMDVAFGGRLGFAWSMLLNLVPLMIFVILCYVAKTDVQLIFAQLLTGMYVLVQMLVLIGLMVEMAKNSICYPTTVFFLFVSGTFVLAAVIHPQEFFCLIHGFTYYLAIPTMYMLLMIYSMCNLHVVSWGTREVKQTKTEKQMEDEKKEAAEQKRQEEERKKNGLTASVMSMAKGSKDEEGWTWRCGSCCSYTCCPHEVNTNERIMELKLILAEMEKMGMKFEGEIAELKKVIEATKASEEKEEMNIEEKSEMQSRPNSVQMQPRQSPTYTETVSEVDEESVRLDDEDGQDEDNEVPNSQEGDTFICQDPAENISTTAEKAKTDEIIRDELENPCWADDKELGDGKRARLPDHENQFFQDLIDVYLYPLLKDKIKEEQDAAGLKDLRNRMSVAFLLLNTIFVVVVFVMQLNMDVLYIPWPCGDDMKVEPIGFMFMMTFGVIMVIQIIGMLVHRTSTFMHIMATTALQCFRNTDESSIQDMIELAKKLGKLDYEDRMTMSSLVGTAYGTNFSDMGSGLPSDDVRKEAKKTIFRIAGNVKRRAAIPMSVNHAFAKRLEKLNKKLADENADYDDIQRKLLGGAKAGFLSQRQTKAALKTYRNIKELSENAPANDACSVDYSTSSRGGTVRGGKGGVTFVDDYDDDYQPPGRTRSVRQNPVYDSMNDPEADY